MKGGENPAFFVIKFILELDGGDDTVNIKKALISVWDKTNVSQFSKALIERGVKVVATSDTACYLRSQGVEVAQIDEVLKFSESFQNNVKSIHPENLATIPMNSLSEFHFQILKDLSIESFDLVVVNLRPFRLNDALNEEEVLQNIDIARMTLLRIAAKNYRNIIPVCDPRDYGMIVESIDRCGDVELQKRRVLCAKAFLFCYRYDEKVFKTLCDLFALDESELRKS